MGQYYLVMNLSRKEYIDPYAFGDGRKLFEISMSGMGTMTALAVLLTNSNGRGGGDFYQDDPEKIIGSWAEDKIVISGDYHDEDDEINYYAQVEDESFGWENISNAVKSVFSHDEDLVKRWEG